MKGGTRQRGEKWSYYFKYKDETDKWKTKEKSGFSTKKEADKALRQALNDFEETGQMSRQTSYTLEQYINYWFENVGELQLKYKSLVLYRNTFKLHILHELGHIKLHNLTPEILQRYFTKKQKNYNKSTVNAIRNVLSNTFKLAEKQKVIKQSPLKSITLSIKDNKKELKLISQDDVKRIELAVEGTNYQLPFQLALHTGMRRGEILGLTWDNVNFQTNTITINKQLQHRESNLVLTSPKTTSSNRSVRMTKKTRELLTEVKASQDKLKEIIKDDYFSENDFVCCSDDGHPINPISLTSYTSRLAKRLGVTFKFHDLRHLHATMMLEADASIKVIQERLGHSDIGTTLNTYSHVTKKLEDIAIEKFDKLFD